MHVLPHHAPHISPRVSLVGMFLGVVAFPTAIIGTLFVIAKLFTPY